MIEETRIGVIETGVALITEPAYDWALMDTNGQRYVLDLTGAQRLLYSEYVGAKVRVTGPARVREADLPIIDVALIEEIQ